MNKKSIFKDGANKNLTHPKTKKAISLIVLVITIVVMIILAGAIIVTLANNGIIGRAQDAVAKANLKAAQELATVGWSQAYMQPTNTVKDDPYYQTQVENYLKANGFTETELSKYVIVATKQGVSVTLRPTGGQTPPAGDEGGDEPQQDPVSGLYFGECYITKSAEGIYQGVSFYADGSADFYEGEIIDENGNPIMFVKESYPEGSVNYGQNTATYGQMTAAVSPSENSITFGEIVYTCTPGTQNDEGYISDENVEYIYTGSAVEGTTVGIISGKIDTNNIATLVISASQNGGTPTVVQTISVEISYAGHGHIVCDASSGDPILVVSADARHVYLMQMELILTLGGSSKNLVTGIYYDRLYAGENDSADFDSMGIVFHEDGSAEIYGGNSAMYGEDMFCMANYTQGTMVYGQNKITLDSTELTVDPTQNTIAWPNGTVLTLTDQEVHGVYRSNSEVENIYTGTFTDSETDSESGTVIESSYEYLVKLDTNNIISITASGTENGIETTPETSSMALSVTGHDHLICTPDTGDVLMNVSVDGRSMLLATLGVVLNIVDPVEVPYDPNAKPSLDTATITPVDGSSEEAIRSGNPKTGDMVEYNGYIYAYEQYNISGEWLNAADQEMLGDDVLGGWGVKVANQDLPSYPAMESTLFNVPVKNLAGTFAGCVNMVTAPTLSSNVAGELFMTFSSCSTLTNVTLPDVRGLYMTFANCSSLPGATIPSSVKELIMTFLNCTSIATTPLIPEGVTDVVLAFNGCTELVTVQNIPSSVQNLEGAFGSCSKLENVPSLPEGLVVLWSTFSGCTSLEDAPAIPSTVTNMDDAFGGCKSLKEAPALPAGLTKMSGAFQNCELITKIESIPSGVTELSITFAGCKALTDIPSEIREGVTDMSNTFADCIALTTAPVIPSTVTNLMSTFEGCTSLTGTVTINVGNIADSSYYDHCFSGTVQPITLTTTEDCPILDKIAETAEAGNVTVATE